MKSAESQLQSYYASYEPAMAKLGKALRKKMQARLPGFFELVYVYESQGSLVIAYSPTERGVGSEAVCGLAQYPDMAKLYFTLGAQLAKADPGKLLQGRGKTARFVELRAPAELDRPEVEALIAAALKLAKVQVDADAKGAVVIKAEAQKQRAARRKARE